MTDSYYSDFCVIYRRPSTDSGLLVELKSHDISGDLNWIENYIYVKINRAVVVNNEACM